LTDRTATTAVPGSVAALAAERLIAAGRSVTARSVTATAPVRDVLGSTDVALAHNID
jgi:hypothetical protein